jgi:hypothetical protein
MDVVDVVLAAKVAGLSLILLSFLGFFTYSRRLENGQTRPTKSGFCFIALGVCGLIGSIISTIYDQRNGADLSQRIDEISSDNKDLKHELQLAREQRFEESQRRKTADGELRDQSLYIKRQSEEIALLKYALNRQTGELNEISRELKRQGPEITNNIKNIFTKSIGKKEFDIARSQDCRTKTTTTYNPQVSVYSFGSGGFGYNNLVMSPNVSPSTSWENPHSFQYKGKSYYCNNGKLVDVSADDGSIFFENSTWEVGGKEIEREKSAPKVPMQKKR